MRSAKLTYALYAGIIGIVVTALYYWISKNPFDGVHAIRLVSPALISGFYMGLFFAMLAELSISAWLIGGLLNVAIYMGIGYLVGARRYVLALVMLAVCIGGAVATGETGGMDMNQQAWEATFTERGLAVPPQGPREGYWGVRINNGVKTPDALTGWRESSANIEDLIAIDEEGMQHVGSGYASASLLVIGGSVASGAYASEEQATYFSMLDTLLAEAGVDARIDIAASGAWKSEQELLKFRSVLSSSTPTLIIFFDGLNDLILGPRAKARASEFQDTIPSLNKTGVPTADRDYDARVNYYLRNMQVAKELALQRHIPILFVLQPALFEKDPRSLLEKKILYVSMAEYGSTARFQESYAAMRSMLAKMAEPQTTYFLDLSRVFDGMPQTTFSDIYHFSDPGHAAVAKALAAQIVSILTSLTSQP